MHATRNTGSSARAARRSGGAVRMTRYKRQHSGQHVWDIARGVRGVEPEADAPDGAGRCEEQRKARKRSDDSPRRPSRPSRESAGTPHTPRTRPSRRTHAGSRISRMASVARFEAERASQHEPGVRHVLPGTNMRKLKTVRRGLWRRTRERTDANVRQARPRCRPRTSPARER